MQNIHLFVNIVNYGPNRYVYNSSPASVQSAQLFHKLHNVDISYFMNVNAKCRLMSLMKWFMYMSIFVDISKELDCW